MALAEKTVIEIFGRKYEIKADDLTPIEAGALASFITERMQEVQKETEIVDTSKIAVLTALNIADELLRAKRRLQETEDEYLKRLGNWRKMLEAA